MMGTIPFYDLAIEHAAYEADLRAAASTVITSGWYVLGNQLAIFEQAFADYCGVSEVVGVNSGLDALILVLRAWKKQGRLHDGDGVVVAGNTFVATIMAIIENNLRPILVEPDAGTCNISVEGLLSVLSQKPKAVIAVHLFGQICPMIELRRLCDESGLLLLEDAAQAHGATLKGRKAGAFGHAAAFSFYPTKNLGALGDGGGIATDDAELASLLRALRNYGSDRKYFNDHQGLNSRLDEIQAAFLTVKLPYLDRQNEMRRRIADRYRGEIQNPHILLPFVEAERSSHVWHLFVVRSAHRDALMRHFASHEVQTAIHYPVPPHRQHCYRELFGSYSLPLTEQLHSECLSLPMSPVLSDGEIDRVIAVSNSFDPEAVDV